MPSEQALVNLSRREKIMFHRIAASKASEIVQNVAASSITAHYMLKYPGDTISFVAYAWGQWPFPTGSIDDLNTFTDVTQSIMDELVSNGILTVEGKDFYFTDEPDVWTYRFTHAGCEPRT